MNDKELKELQTIKKLLVIQLLSSKVPAGAVAEIIGMNRGDFSTMFPLRKLKQKDSDASAKKAKPKTSKTRRK